MNSHRNNILILEVNLSSQKICGRFAGPVCQYRSRRLALYPDTAKHAANQNELPLVRGGKIFIACLEEPKGPEGIDLEIGAQGFEGRFQDRSVLCRRAGIRDDDVEATKPNACG